MRVGLMVGSDKERSREDRLTGLLDDGKTAEAQGFASFWFPQVPGYLDAMTAVALAATMEVWRFAQSGRLRLLLVPGLALQRLTTREPTLDETRIALRAVASVLSRELP